jgi:tetratricopeptide (TPR) repeat protein
MQAGVGRPPVSRAGGMVRARAIALAIAAWLAAAPAAAEWVRVETPNFTVYGESGERRIREVADEFERFREALARVIPGAAAPVAVPTLVVVFGSQRSLAPYRPRFNGKPVTLNGYFFSNEDASIVALADVNRGDSLRTIFHEYVHLVVDNTARGMPVWLDEGLAEYYSTFQLSGGGGRALVGQAIPSHRRLLNARRLLTIPELLAVERASPDYHAGDRRSLFYAQSWALVHMLVSGPANRAADLAEYARLVSDGAASLDAWHQVFEDEDIVSELEIYVGRSAMRGGSYRFEETIPRATSHASIVSDGDARAVLGELLKRVAEPRQAAERFEEAIALQPPSALARALYGLLLIDEDRAGEAVALLLEAATDPTDWLVQYHVATGLTRIVTAAPDPDPAMIATARDALARAGTARPRLGNVAALSARLDTAEGTDLTRALQASRRARGVSPGRTDYTLLESFILMRRGEYAAARGLLAPLIGPMYSPEVHTEARTVLGQIARLEQAAMDFVAGLQGRRPAAEPAGPPIGLVPRYRTLVQGERRIEGLLERIECSTTGVVLYLRVDGRTERFGAASLSSIEFFSHRGDLRADVTCGPRSPSDLVYLTWRREGDTSTQPGRAVAVEFLPVP